MHVLARLIRRFQHANPDGEGGATGDQDKGDQGEGEGDDKGLMSQSTAWSWQEGLAGEGDRPDWLAPKFKTVEEQAKNYQELESKQGKYGAFFGSPEGDYELTLPEGIEGEFDKENPLLQAVTTQAKEMGLSQAAFNKLLHSYVEHDAGLVANEAAQLANVASELGENGEAYIQDTWTRLNQVLGPDEAKALDGVVVSAPAIKALNKLMQSEAVLPADGGDTPGQLSRDELSAMRYEKYPDGHAKAGKVKYMEDPEYRKKVDGLYAKLFPGRDEHFVG